MPPDPVPPDPAGRPGQPVPALPALRPDELQGLGGEPARVTLLQLSTAFCAPCRATRRVLRRAIELVDGAQHVEVDAESHLDLVRRLGVTATPVTLLLDEAGVERGRAAGVPTVPAVLSALAPLLAPEAPGELGGEPGGLPDRPAADAGRARSLPSA